MRTNNRNMTLKDILRMSFPKHNGDYKNGMVLKIRHPKHTSSWELFGNWDKATKTFIQNKFLDEFKDEIKKPEVSDKEFNKIKEMLKKKENYIEIGRDMNLDDIWIKNDLKVYIDVRNREIDLNVIDIKEPEGK